MRKVKLCFVKDFVDIPTVKDTFQVETEILPPDGFGNMKLQGARVYEAAHLKNTSDSMPVDGDRNAVVLDFRDVHELIGQLMMYIEATYSDQEQRKAHKDLVKKTVRDWQSARLQRAVDIADCQLGGTIVKGKAITLTHTAAGQTTGNDDKGESVLDK